MAHEAVGSNSLCNQNGSQNLFHPVIWNVTEKSHLAEIRSDMGWGQEQKRWQSKKNYEGSKVNGRICKEKDRMPRRMKCDIGIHEA